MNLEKLNGWQRLGILLSAIWLAVVVVGAIVVIVSATDRLKAQLESGRALVQSEWANATIFTVRNDQNTKVNFPEGFIPNPFTEQQAREVRSEYSDLDDPTFVERYQNSYPDVNFGPVNAKYEQLLDELNIKHPQDRQWAVLRISGYAFLVWIVPSGFVFFLGRAVVWVWRGFKLKGESQ